MDILDTDTDPEFSASPYKTHYKWYLNFIKIYASRHIEKVRMSVTSVTPFQRRAAEKIEKSA